MSNERRITGETIYIENACHTEENTEDSNNCCKTPAFVQADAFMLRLKQSQLSDRKIEFLNKTNWDIFQVKSNMEKLGLSKNEIMYIVKAESTLDKIFNLYQSLDSLRVSNQIDQRFSSQLECYKCEEES